MARDKIRLRDEIGGTNVFRPEAEMRNRDRPGFLGIVNEVTLRVIVGVLADDLDGFLICADRAVSAEAVKQGPHHLLWLDGKAFIYRQAGAPHVVVDADGKMIFRAGNRQIFKHGLDHGRREFF